MGQKRLNMCMLLHVHNDKTDALDLKQIANKCVARNSNQRSVFENFAYHVAGNIGGNYIAWFREKITGFLLAELNIAF